ncbi:MAG: hypothetical protein EBU90_27255 [Proteobacteria bacterium]|nr:hypothetical protein [Pseudomonadota bacterium]
METTINNEFTWGTVDRHNLLDLTENIDSETKDYCVNDCIKCWDEKQLWDDSPPVTLQKAGELLSVIFWSTEIVNGEKVVYIQRLFTPKEHRQKGYFTMLLRQLHYEQFDKGYRFIKMFIDRQVKVYKDLNYVSVFDTRDGKYAFCLQPMLCWDLKNSNTIVARGHLYDFYSRPVIEYIETQIIKYA